MIENNSRKIRSFGVSPTLVTMCILWIIVWTLPWGRLPSVQANIYIAFLTDMIRLGIALLVFCVPGALLFYLIRKEDVPCYKLPGIIPIGFTFSVFLIAIFGLAGRILGLSFGLIKYSFALTGLVELILLAIYKPKFNILNMKTIGNIFNFKEYYSLIIALIFVELMSFHDFLFFIDDTSYLAYLTNWQHSTQLGFKSFVHELDTIEHVRFWLAMYPMGQALLSDLSGIPGLLLLGNYLEPFLVMVAVLTSYWFARTMKLSKKTAGVAVLIQVTLYAWMVGDNWPVGIWFYESMAEDKVTAVFILAPVFFVFFLTYIKNPVIRNLLLVYIAGIALCLTHPVILFFTLFIVVCMGGLGYLFKEINWRIFIFLAVLSLSLMLPFLIIRMSDYHHITNIPYDGESASQSFEIEKYTRVVNDVFYGLNPGVLKFVDLDFDGDISNFVAELFRFTPVIISLSTGLLVIKKLRSGPLYWYITSCLFLVTCATIPFTGWILGYFVSSRLISRTSWFLPLGISGALLLKSTLKWFGNKFKDLGLSLNLSKGKLFREVIFSVLCFIFISPILVLQFLPRVPLYFDKLNHNKQLADIGAHIDQNTYEPVVVISLDYLDMQLLPGISSNARLISFREEKPYNGFNSSLSIEEIEERINASNAIISLNQSEPDDPRCSEIEKYDVQFVLARSENVNTFGHLIEFCNTGFEIDYETSDLILLKSTRSEIIN